MGQCQPPYFRSEVVHEGFLEGGVCYDSRVAGLQERSDFTGSAHDPERLRILLQARELMLPRKII